MGKIPQPKNIKKSGGLPSGGGNVGATNNVKRSDDPESRRRSRIAANYYIALPAVYVLLVLYCGPIFILLNYLVWLWSNSGTFDPEHNVPTFIASLGIVVGDPDGANGNVILDFLHKLILPIITLISGIFAIAASQRRVRYWLIAFVIGLLAMTMITFFLYLSLKPHDASGTVYNAISFLFSRTFESLGAYFTLLLGLSIAPAQGSGADQRIPSEEQLPQQG